MTDEQIGKLTAVKCELDEAIKREGELLYKAELLRNARSVEDSLRIQRESTDPDVVAYCEAAKVVSDLGAHYRALREHYESNSASRFELPLQVQP